MQYQNNIPGHADAGIAVHPANVTDHVQLWLRATLGLGLLLVFAAILAPVALVLALLSVGQTGRGALSMLRESMLNSVALISEAMFHRY
ncbi:hypothetical protein [Stakelama tenebrarum]|uniref:Uncharacterized protein n=1 Tax=Stakelama tenebrarum TaxID=2711215 RepID=A0A6G6Y282_9SPHN|nr:hypothetical protein [Sphingosinithalassobacter tenebrarum]QIG78917.1 hypothetical protein G5C33_03355 [Sphingosinithalassobacter tenebrarum]